jgi:hypothetical protein
MNQNKALEVLIAAVEVAQTKGAFTLKDARVICQAIDCFSPENNPVEAKEGVTEVTKDERPEENIPAV